MKKKILVIAAHPDDDALGCGGTIAKLSKEKSDVFVVYFTDGVSARSNNKSNKKEVLGRRENSIKAAKILGIKKCFFFSYPDNKLDKTPLLEITQKIEKIIKDTNPEIVITHSEHDLNIDHHIVNRAVITATRPKPKSKIKKILLFETLSSSEWKFSNKKNFFNPNYFVDISKTINKKISALKCYKKEIMKWPHPRSVKGVRNLAMYRGQNVGLKYVEAFYLLRQTT